MRRSDPPVPRILLGSISVIARTLACVIALLFAIFGIAAHAQQRPFVDPNVNMVKGTTFPTGDPYLQRQNEPSIAVSTRNPCHLVAGANDYRSVDIPFDDTVPPNTENNLSLAGDAWLGLFKSFDCGAKWQSTLLPGYPQDTSDLAPQLKGHVAGADPTVRAGTNGLFYYSGMVFNRGSQGTSKIFMARLIDNNNIEKGDPIQFLGVSIIDTGTKGQFLDKPWMAVDVPRASYGPGSQLGGSQTCSVNGQTLPAGNVYMAWAKFTGSGNQHSKLMFAKSSDCGQTWKQHPITNNQTLSQGANIAVAPHDGTIYLTWREFASPKGNNKPVNFWIATSSDGGETFSAPKKIAGDVLTFDQPRTTSTFRSNALPAITADHQDRVYVAWSARGYAKYWDAASASMKNSNDARIVMVSSADRGKTWTAVPYPIDPNPARGHQMMPQLAFAAGKLQAIWYDAREDASGVFKDFIDDKEATTLLHTIDVRGAQATPAAIPVFVSDQSVSLEISKYRRWNLEIKDSAGNVTGYESKEIGSNPPNLPMYANGTTPFIGDYIDVSGLPSFPVQTTSGQLWQPNIGPLNLMGATAANLSTAGFPTLPTFHAVWTDNRDVNYAQCTTTPAGQMVGQRNANIYTARLTPGLFVGSPGNTKPFGYRMNPKTRQQELIQRGFVVFAQNTTDSLKFFRFKIETQPVGGRASFKQFDHNGPLTEVIVAIPAVSTVARTVYATSTDVNAQLLINVEQYDHSPTKETVIGADGLPIVGGNGQVKVDWRWFAVPNGLRGSVLLNPDRTNPTIIDPDVDSEVPQIATDEVHNPSMFDAQFFKRTTRSNKLDVLNARTPDPENPDPENPDPENPDPENQSVTNPDPENPDPENPDPENPDPENPDPENPDPENSLLTNSAISDSEVASSSITDIQWRVHNNGNTTSAYRFRPTLPKTFSDQRYQLIVTRRSMALALGADCTPAWKSTNQVLSNIVNYQPKTPDPENPDPENPDPENPDPENPDPENPDPENPDPENATFFLAPGDTATVTLRVFDLEPNNSDPAPQKREEIAAKTAAQAANTGQTTVATAVAGPDLTLFDTPAAVSPAISRPGKQATVTFTLSNRGTGSAYGPLVGGLYDPILTRLYFSADQTLDGDDLLLATIQEPSPFVHCTDPNDAINVAACSTTSNVQVTVPPIAGTSYVIVVTDEDGEVFEADELNNRVVVPIVVANYNLSFTSQPTNTTQDFTMAPVQVAISHPDALPVPATDVPSVTLALATNPSAATLSGTLTVSNPLATPGLVTFSDLRINNVGTGYTLSASASFSNAATSAAFNIEADLPPVAVNDTYTTNEEQALTPASGVLTNDSDPATKGTKPASYTFDAAKETDPSNGVLAFNANGTFTYTPNASFAGSDSFTYRVRDGRPGNSAVGTVNISVVNVNDAPSFTKGADQTVNEDAGPQAAPGWATNISTGPANESSQAVDFIVTNNNNALFSAQPAVSANGTLTYTGATDASGVATVTVRIHDSGGTANGGVDTSAPQTFTITINNTNDAPVASADSYTVNEDGNFGIDAGDPVNGKYLNGLLANDTDADNNLLIVEYLTTTANGTLLPHANGSFSYTPNANFFGTDSFTYRAFDGTTPGNTVTVTLNVVSVNDAPSFTKGPNVSVAMNSAAQTFANWATSISAGAANEESQTLSFIVSNSDNTLFTVQPAISSTGTLTFTPRNNRLGTATVTVQLRDNGGTANGGADTSAAQTFTISLTNAATTYIVTNTNDSGTGSLRQALINANANDSPDTISFNIAGGGVKTITPLSPLPTIVFAVTIDGTTQPGYAGTPLIALNGTGLPAGTAGLSVAASNVTVRALGISQFPGVGISVSGVATSSVRITQNSISNNGALGIDLAPAGFNANDALDADSGPNGLQNFPVISGAYVNGGSSTLIQGSLASTPNAAFQIELYTNTSADATGYGEGQTYRTTLNVTTDGSGNASIATTLPTALTPGSYVTATATDAGGNTSEFSLARAVTVNTPPTSTSDQILTVTDYAMTTNPAANDVDVDVAAPEVRHTYRPVTSGFLPLNGPGGVAVVTSTGKGYFTGGNQSAGTGGKIGILDLATNAIVGSIPLPGNFGAAFTLVDQASQIVFFRGGINLLAVDARPTGPTSNQLVLNVNLGTINSWTLDSTRHRLYVTSQSSVTGALTSGRITVIDTDPGSGTFLQVIAEAQVPSVNGGTTAIAVNTVTNKLYVGAMGLQPGLYVADAATLGMSQVFSTSGQGNITSVAVNETDNLVYAIGGNLLHAVDGNTNTKVGQLQLATVASNGNYDTRLLIHGVTGRVYVRLSSFPSASNLVVVDGKRGSPTINTVITTVALGRENNTAQMVLDQAIDRLVATSPIDLKTHVIDTTNNQIVGTITATQALSRISLDASTHRAYLTSGPGYIKVVNVATATQLTDVEVGRQIWGIAVDPLTHSVYVSETGLGTAIRKLNDTGITGSLVLPHVNGREVYMARNSVTNKIYALNGGATSLGDADAIPGFVHVIDGNTNTVTNNIPVGNSPFAIAIDEANNKVYIGNQSLTPSFPGGITILDAANGNTVTTANVSAIPSVQTPANISVGRDMAVTSSGRVYFRVTGGAATQMLGVLDGTVATPVNLGNVNINIIRYNPATNRLYVGAIPVGGSTNQVFVIDPTTNNVVSTLTVGSPSDFITTQSYIAVDAAANRIYVSDFDENTLSVLNATTHAVLATIPMPFGPSSVAIDEVHNRVYVANAYARNLAIIDGATLRVARVLALPIAPVSLHVDSSLTPARIFALATESEAAISVVDDPGTSAPQITSVTQGAHGTVVLNADGSVTYTSASGYVGADSYTYTTVDGNGGTTTSTANVTVYAERSIAPTTLANGTVGQNYSQQLTSTGGTGSPAVFTVSGFLPGGLHLSSTGLLSGKFQQSGDFTFTVTARDTGEDLLSESRTYTIIVGPPVITPTSVPSATINVPYSTQLLAGGATGAVTWSLNTNGHPALSWLSLSNSGVLSGTPTTYGTTPSFTVTATDSASPAPQTASRTYTIFVSGPLTMADLREGIVLETQPTVSFLGGNGTRGFTAAAPPNQLQAALSSGSLPPGITLGTGGVFTGTPTRHGTYNFSLELRDCLNGSCSSGVTQQVVPKSPAWRVSAKDQQGGSFGGGPTLAFGGSPNRQIAQVFTVGAHGTLTAIGLQSTTCPATQTTISIDIQRLTANGRPDGTTIATGSAQSNFNAITVAPPLAVAIGDRLAFVARIDGPLTCTITNSAPYDSYQGGDAYVRTTGGWSKLALADVDNNGSVDDVYDIPSFRTLIQPAQDVTYFTASHGGNTTTVLNDGKVLIIGNGGSNTTVEIYDPATNTVTPTGSLNKPRSNHTATLLGDGKVLVVGGRDENGNKHATAEIYDPSTGQFTLLPDMLPTRLQNSRENHRATRYVYNSAEKVLITGGTNPSNSNLAAVEIFDVATQTFSMINNNLNGRQSHAAVLLNNGKILLAGGYTNSGPSAELFNPATNTFTSTSTSMIVSSRGATAATILNDGRVLITGGQSGDVRNEAEIYDPSIGANGSFTATGNMSTPRYSHTATLLTSGKVLVAGGFAEQSLASWTLPLATMEVFDPATGTFSYAGSMETRRANFGAARLGNGKVFLVGGFSQGWMTGNTGELFDPAAAPPSAPPTPPASSNVIISPYRLPDAPQNANYSYQLQATGAGNVWSMLPNTSTFSSNPLPPGITMDSSGLLQGAPTLTGYYNFGVRAVDAAGVEATKVLSINVPAPMTINTTSLGNPELFSSFGCISTSNGSGTKTFSILSGTLPQGVTFGGSTSSSFLCFSGQIKSTGTFNFTVRVVDQSYAPQTVDQSYTVNVYAADQSSGSSTASAISFGAGTGVRLAERVITGITGSLRGIRFNGLSCVTNPTTISVEIQGLDTGGKPNGQVLATGTGLSPFGTMYLNTPLFFAADQPFAVVFDAAASCSVRPPTFDSYPGDGYVSTGGGGWTLLQNTYANQFDVPLVSIVEPVAGVIGMNAWRGGHTETLLGNGKVLIAGGSCCSATGTAEVFDPATNTTTATNNMTITRYGHTATLLPNGLVLLTGGQNISNGTRLASAELYNPATNSFVATGSMNSARMNHRATLLLDGTVLITGGNADSSGQSLSSAEIYNPNGGTFTLVPNNMTGPRQNHTATLLGDGRVLIVAGYGTGATTDLYSPGSMTFTAGPTLSTWRGRHTATLLPSGKVLIAGGTGGNNGEALSSTELYDPSVGPNGSITSEGNMLTPRIDATTIVVADGSVLIAGGYTDSTCCSGHPGTASIERYVPGTGFEIAAPMSVARYAHTMTLMGNGKALITGTYGWSSAAGRTAEVYEATARPAHLATARQTAPANAPLGVPIVATGGAGGPYTVTLVSGTLPNGAQYNSGLISGTPTQTGTFSLAFQIVDGAGKTSYQLFTLLIDPLTITTASLPTAYYNTPYSTGMASSGGVGAITWSIASGSLPPGISLNQNTGAISGTTNISCCGYSVTIRATDSVGQTALKALFISVQNPLSVGTTSLGDGIAGSTYFGGLFANGNYASPLTWSLSGQPIGLQVNTSTGQFQSNYPANILRQAGRFMLTATVSDASNPIQTAARSIPLNVWAQDQATGSLMGQPDVPVPSTRKLAQVLRTGTPYGVSAIEPFQLMCDPGVVLTAQIFPVGIGDVPDDTGSPIRTATLTSNAFGFFNERNLVFATSASFPMGSKFAVVYSTSGNCVQKDWSIYDYKLEAKAYINDNGGGWVESSVAIGRHDLPHVSLIEPSASVRFLAGWHGGHVSATLNDGRVFLAGSDQYTEIYDPSANDLRLTANMSHARQEPTATLLANGKVLVAGGQYWNGSETVSATTTQIFNPANDQFEPSQNMSVGRMKHTATRLNNGNVLLAGGRYFVNSIASESDTADLFDGSGNFITTLTMNRQRAEHTATLLSDGRVLLVGGWGNGAGPVAEIYDPSSGPYGSFTGINAAIDWPSQHTATLLTAGPNAGKVLIAGGWGFPQLAGNYLFDPSDNSFTSFGALLTRRLDHTATVLPNGKIVFAGGVVETSYWSSTASVEIYDPITDDQVALGDLIAERNTHTANLVLTPDGLKLAVAGGYGSSVMAGSSLEQFDLSAHVGSVASAPAMSLARRGHVAVQLDNGTVLLAGNDQFSSSAEIYNPAFNTTSPTSTNMLQGRCYGCAFVKLNDGKVLISGGWNGGTVFSSAELYNPANGQFSATNGNMTANRLEHTAVLLDSGKVLILGGYDGTNPYASAELYDPVTGTFSSTGSMANVRYRATAIKLNNGKVLVAGGFSTGSNVVTTAELYDPLSGTFSPTGAMFQPRLAEVPVLLNDGRVLFAGGWNNMALASAEVYTPGTGAFGNVGPMSTPRSGHFAAKLANGMVVVGGGVDASGTELTSVELFNPFTNTFTSIGSLPTPRVNARAIALADGRVMITGGTTGVSIVNTVQYFVP